MIRNPEPQAGLSSEASDTTALVRRAAEGDDDAFRTLVRRVYPALRRWALAKTGHPDHADEAVQETLIRMHRGLAGFSGEAALTSWLYRILTRVVIDLNRGKQPRAVPQEELEEMPDRTPDPIDRIQTHRLADVVRDYTRGLPPRQREVLELVDHQGIQAVEAAELLELKPVTVRANLFKARRNLRERILERYPEMVEGYGA